VPSASEVFLRLLVGELGPPNLPKFSLMANSYTHTECYYTARQIWTKYVRKHAVLRTDVPSAGCKMFPCIFRDSQSRKSDIWTHELLCDFFALLRQINIVVVVAARTD